MRLELLLYFFTTNYSVKKHVKKPKDHNAEDRHQAVGVNKNRMPLSLCRSCNDIYCPRVLFVIKCKSEEK